MQFTGCLLHNVRELQKIIDSLVSKGGLIYEAHINEDATFLGYANFVYEYFYKQKLDVRYIKNLIRTLLKDIDKNIREEKLNPSEILIFEIRQSFKILSEEGETQRIDDLPVNEDEKIFDQADLEDNNDESKKSLLNTDSEFDTREDLIIEPNITVSKENRLVDEKTGAELPFFAYKDKQEGEREDRERQRLVNDRFFQVNKHKLKKNGRAEKFSFKLYQARVDKKPVEITDISGRGFILVLKNILKYDGCFPDMKFTFGITLIECQKVPPISRVNQKGNFRLRFHHKQTSYPMSYGEKMEKFLSEVTNHDSELQKLLMKKITEKYRNPTPFSTHDFNEKGIIRSDEEKPIADILINKVRYQISYLNFIIILGYFEVARRLFRSPKEHKVHPYSKMGAKELDQLPVGLLTARSAKLVEEKGVPLKDVYGESQEYGVDSKIHRAKYGVTTGRYLVDNYQLVANKAKELSTDYYKFLTTLPPWSRFFTELNDQYISASSNFMQEELDYSLAGRSESDSGNKIILRK